MSAQIDVRLESIRRLLSSVRLVPEDQARYQPLVVDALLFFLSRLPAERVDRILLSQGALTHVTADDRLVALLRECPTLHKLGQVVAHERFLPPSLRVRLSALESLPPTTDVTGITHALRAELGHLPGLQVAEHALAEGSVAVVIPFEWSDAERGKSRGVLKVLKPRAVESMRQELAIWPEFSEFLEAHAGDDGLPMLDYREMLDGVGKLLLDEIDLEKEQQNLAWAQTFYSNTTEVKIPRLLPFSTPSVTAMERIEGAQKVTDPAIAARVRDRLAKSIVKTLIAMPFWRVAQPGARFHADPHPGNLLVTPEGQLAVIDWALVTELSEAQLSGVVRALLAALTFDEAVLIPAIGELGRVDDEALLRQEVAFGLRRVRRGAAPGFMWLTDLLDRVGRAGAMHFPEEITLFRKSMLTLSGVLADVSEHVRADQLLIRTGVGQFLKELRIRLDAPLGSRALGTHLSTSDLIRVWTAVPFISTRFFLDSWRDLLRERDKASGAKNPAGP